MSPAISTPRAASSRITPVVIVATFDALTRRRKIEVVAKEILDDLKEYVEGYHDADGLNVSISVD